MPQKNTLTNKIVNYSKQSITSNSLKAHQANVVCKVKLALTVGMVVMVVTVLMVLMVGTV